MICGWLIDVYVWVVFVFWALLSKKWGKPMETCMAFQTQSSVSIGNWKFHFWQWTPMLRKASAYHNLCRGGKVGAKMLLSAASAEHLASSKVLVVKHVAQADMIESCRPKIRSENTLDWIWLDGPYFCHSGWFGMMCVKLFPLSFQSRGREKQNVGRWPLTSPSVSPSGLFRQVAHEAWRCYWNSCVISCRVATCKLGQPINAIQLLMFESADTFVNCYFARW